MITFVDLSMDPRIHDQRVGVIVGLGTWQMGDVGSTQTERNKESVLNGTTRLERHVLPKFGVDNSASCFVRLIGSYLYGPHPSRSETTPAYRPLRRALTPACL